MRRLATVIVLLTVVAFGAGCRSTTGESFGQNIDDTTITTEVKSKLAADEAKSLTAVSVTTVKGNVSLDGVVPTAADRARAEQIAQRVAGVTKVTNNLQLQKK